VRCLLLAASSLPHHDPLVIARITMTHTCTARKFYCFCFIFVCDALNALRGLHRLGNLFMQAIGMLKQTVQYVLVPPAFVKVECLDLIHVFVLTH
jgi:hypothetical protein